MSQNKKLFIQTLGCQMNDTDSQHMASELEKHKDYVQTNIMEEEINRIYRNTWITKETTNLFLEQVS